MDSECHKIILRSICIVPSLFKMYANGSLLKKKENNAKKKFFFEHKQTTSLIDQQQDKSTQDDAVSNWNLFTRFLDRGEAIIKTKDHLFLVLN
jgi:hypothetical protein